MIHHYKGITIERSQNTTPGGGIDKITLAELLAEAGYSGDFWVYGEEEDGKYDEIAMFTV